MPVTSEVRRPSPADPPTAQHTGRAPGPPAPCTDASVDRSRALAHHVHHAQVDRAGEPMIAHVARVADRVPRRARAVAWSHDACERGGGSPAEVAALVGLDEDEREALVLLTKSEGEDLLAHTRRVVEAPHGRARDLAVAVKRADIDDHRGRRPADARYDVARALLATA